MSWTSKLVTRIRSRADRKQRGMTVLELTVSAALVMVVLAPVVTFIAATQKNQNSHYNSMTQQADTRTSLQEITRFLREAEYPQGMNYTSAHSDMFAVAGSYDMAFFSQMGAVNGSGTIDEIEYYLSGSTLYRKVTPPDSTSCTTDCSYTGTGSTKAVLTDFVNQSLTGCTNFTTAVPLFSYSEQETSSGQITSLPTGSSNSLINYVTITALTGPPSGQSGSCTEVQTSVSLRNWRP